MAVSRTVVWGVSNTLNGGKSDCCMGVSKGESGLCVQVSTGLNATESAKMQNHSTQDSRVVPHRGTNWAALRLTAQIGRDAVLSESYGRGY